MNKLTKVLISGAAFIATVGVGVYVKHVYDTQHTINVPMQESIAYGQSVNMVVLCYNIGAVSKETYDEVTTFFSKMKAVDPSGIESLPDKGFLERKNEDAKTWIRNYFNQFTPEQMRTTEPSIEIVEMCKPEEKKALDEMKEIKDKYNKPLLFWK